MQIKFEEINLRHVDVWLYVGYKYWIYRFYQKQYFLGIRKKNSKFSLAGYLEGESLSLLEGIQKVVYPPVFLGEKLIKVTEL